MKFDDMKISNSRKNFLFAVMLSFLTYVIFFGQFLTPSFYFWSSGDQTTDAQTKHLPARTYFYEKVVNEHTFPFWTEKLYSGFPIYADAENAYLNPINDAAILMFGPWNSYKVLHLLEYLIGSLSLYVLLKRKNIGLAGFAAANAIFYFNTFFINHQVHFNMIMSLYLLPAAFLLADLFIEKRKLKYILLQALIVANAVLWGHMQSAVILGMGIFLYMSVFSFKRMRLTQFVFYFISVVFLIFVVTLPQLAPTYELFGQSSRSSSTEYLKGSLSPRMAIFSFVPYLFGGYENFVGQDIKDGFGYGEVYTYFGISSMILAILVLLLLKKSRETILAFIFIWVFLLFGFMDSNKLFPDNTPIVTLFRVWSRTAVLSSFGIALLAGILVEKINELSLKNIKRNFLFVLSPIIYIWLLAGMETGGAARKVNSYVSFDFIQTYPYFPILMMIVLALAGALLMFFVLKKWRPSLSSNASIIVKVVLVTIVLFDLVYFNKDVLSCRLQDISDFKLASVSSEFENKRVILNSQLIVGMESLYYDNWSPFGSSQLKAKSYVSYLNKLGLKLRGVSFSNDPLPIDYQKLDKAGIVAISTVNEGVVYLNDNKLDLIKNDLEGHYVEKKEGHVTMQIINPADAIVGTYLRYDPNWAVKVDGKKTKITKNEIFFDFPLEKGEHLVEISYYPKIFLIAASVSLACGILICLSVYFFRKRIEKWLLG